MHCSILNARFQLLVVLIMGDNSDDEVLEISRDQFALRKDYGFFFSHEVPNVHQQEDGITMNEGVGKTSKGKEHDVDCTSKGIIAEGSQSLKKDVTSF
ncbi:hypothetical protein Hanom_Chr04g00361911 [Helianthus anomalus]